MLLKMIDGGITNIESAYKYYGMENTITDQDFENLRNDFWIEMTHGTIYLKMEVGFPVSGIDIMKPILSNVDSIRLESEMYFFKWLKVTLEKKYGKNLSKCIFQLKNSKVFY